MRGLQEEAAGAHVTQTGSKAHALPPQFCRVRRDRRIHALGRFHIGGGAYGVWAFLPTGGELPGTYRCIAPRPLRLQWHSNVCCSAKGGEDHGVGPPRSRVGRPTPLRQEASMDSPVRWRTL